MYWFSWNQRAVDVIGGPALFFVLVPFDSISTWSQKWSATPLSKDKFQSHFHALIL